MIRNSCEFFGFIETPVETPAWKIISIDTKISMIPWESDIKNSFWNICVGVWVGGQPWTNFSHISKDAQFNSASFDFDKKFARGCPPTQTPTQMFQNQFLISDSHGIMDILVSIEMIFQALQTRLSRLMIKSVKSKIPKFPEFSLFITWKVIVTRQFAGSVWHGSLIQSVTVSWLKGISQWS